MLNPRIISNGCHRDAFVACSFRMAVIRSLSEAVRLGKKAKVLSLRKSQDLLCCNLMCEKVGTPCICRLSRALDRVPHLKRLDLADNDLEDLPISLWDMRYLSVLDLSKNKLKTLSSQVSRLFDLKVLRVCGNPYLGSLPAEVAFMPGLKVLHIDKPLRNTVENMSLPRSCNVVLH
eukprot:jgi/Botrbrau1/1876/Bobra.146_1s0062.2